MLTREGKIAMLMLKVIGIFMFFAALSCNIQIDGGEILEPRCHVIVDLFSKQLMARTEYISPPV